MYERIVFALVKQNYYDDPLLSTSHLTREIMRPETRAKLEQYKHKIADLRENFLGYPENQDLHYSEVLSHFGLFESCIDNVGDPFVESTYKIDSREFETEVIAFFADLYRLKEYWGYVTSCGTEGNIRGIFLGRELYPNGILYYSEDAHYSVPKAATLLRMEAVVIKSQHNGEMDYDDFLSKLDSSRPAIINANIGTTVKGAMDDLERIKETLLQKGVTEYHVHCDAALSGMILPFLEGAPRIDFRGIVGSISVSGHKFIGTPLPCGIFLTRSELMAKNTSYIDYIDTADGTIMGSRSGLAVIFFMVCHTGAGNGNIPEGGKYLCHQCEIFVRETSGHRLSGMDE